MSDNAKEWIKDILMAVALAVVILIFISPTIVQEQSMESTLEPNDYLFVSKQSYTIFGDVHRGDIVVFHSSLTRENGAEKLLIKRVIGLPGDTIAIHDGCVIINGEPQEEPYTKDGYTVTEMDEITVPEGEYFMMGDNRQVSVDSRDSRVGTIPGEAIVGKAVFRLFPFSKIGGLYK